MVRTACTLALLGLTIGAFPAAVMAQDSAKSTEQAQPAESASDQIAELKETIEEQSKQIDVLAQEIARLNMLLEGKNGTAMVPPSAPPSQAGLAASTPAVVTQAAPPPKAVAANAPSAPATPQPTPSGPVHIVAKGETLTAIAKHYKITLPDLMKVNKIADVRRLQIGQAVFLPPDAKIPDSPTPAASQTAPPNP
jgi:LysM repeat protein